MRWSSSTGARPGGWTAPPPWRPGGRVLRRLGEYRSREGHGRRKVHAAPEDSDALSPGKLSFDQVKPLVEVAKPETDATLAEQATHWSAKQVREPATAARAQSDQQATGFYARRFLRFDDRRRSLTGVLPQDQYAVVKSAVIARARRGRRDDAVRPADGRCPGGGVRNDERGRTRRPRGRAGDASKPSDGGRPCRHLLPGGRCR